MKYLSKQFPIPKDIGKQKVTMWALYEGPNLVWSGVPYAMLQAKRKSMLSMGISQKVLKIKPIK